MLFHQEGATSSQCFRTCSLRAPKNIHQLFSFLHRNLIIFVREFPYNGDQFCALADGLATLTLAARDRTLVHVRCRPRGGQRRWHAPSMMDTRETEERSDQDWQTVRDASKRLEEHITIIVKVTDGTALQELPPDCVGPSVVHAAALTTTEKKDTYVKVRTVQNLIAVDSYRPTAIEKLLRIRQISIMGTQHPVLTYQANGTNTVKGVIHGTQCAVTEKNLKGR
ncbi:hypothetical protein HPB49_022083 [Dermacentor silvarum]|uniref:Uncharacterized protein n=1 Tax=Dermacentor silvarum TaxID=543639 RepID=A0ACB8DG73_DERSI|nr:hypothetical protein HPB49_022083 [Dermacentor silvarum]